MPSLFISFTDKKEAVAMPAGRQARQWLLSVVLGLGVLAVWVIARLVFGFNLPVYILAMAAICAILFVTPSAGLPIIILGTMWFQRWFTLEPITLGDVAIKLYPLDIVFLATIIFLFFHQAFGNTRRRLPFKRLELWLLIFFAFCSVYLLRGVLNTHSDPALAVSTFKNYAFYGLLFFLVTFEVQSLTEFKRLLKVFLAGGLGIIVFVVIGLLRGEGLWVEYNPLSTSGLRLLSFPHAFYLSLVLVMTLVLFVYRLRPVRFTIIALWLQLIGVLGSLMRHLWVSLFAVAVFIFLAIPRQAKRMLVKFFMQNAAVCALVVVALTFLFTILPLSSLAFRLQDSVNPVYSRAKSVATTAADSSARWRIYAWRAAQEAFLQSPLLGVGYGQELVIDFDTYRVVVPMRELHNSYLVLVVQMGLAGFALFLIILWQLFKPVLAWRHGRGYLWPYQLATCSMLLVFMASAFWQPYFETNFTGIFFWILAAAFVVSVRLEDTPEALTK
ncbi:MAG: O-antigen ligase family protein [Parcubacteria group bacterium]|nr:O-antigen ligase family protein [Parcubacteria group bacterium]